MVVLNIVMGISFLIVGLFLGVQSGRKECLRQNFVGYFDVHNNDVYFDSGFEIESLNEREYILLECIDLSNKNKGV